MYSHILSLIINFDPFLFEKINFLFNIESHFNPKFYIQSQFLYEKLVFKSYLIFSLFIVFHKLSLDQLTSNSE